MPPRNAPNTQQEYLIAIWERLGRLEGTLEANAEARAAACAAQVASCGVRFDAIEERLDETPASGLTLRVTQGGLGRLAAWVIPPLVAAILAVLGMRGWDAAAGQGGGAPVVAKDNAGGAVRP